MKKRLKFSGFFVFIIAYIALFSAQLWAGGQVWIEGGDITLIVDTGIPGEDILPAVDTSCTLFWKSPGAPGRKITVETTLASPRFTLKVAALDVVRGRAEPEVTLSTTAKDFVTSIPKTTGQEYGSCTLQYTAIATVEQGTGSDVHTVIYSILNI